MGEPAGDKGKLPSADPQPGAAVTATADSGEAHELTCAICLDSIELEELSILKGCEHAYCSKCILAWAVHKDPPWCPQCKAPFSRLVTYRALDGTLQDFPAEESVCLLKRACWFQAHLREAEAVAAAVPAPFLLDAADAAAIAEAATTREPNDYGRYYEEYDDDEEVEAFYFSAAAGRARITLGNRRFGNNGYIASGRMQARPAQPARPSKGKAAAKGEASGSGAGAGPPCAGQSPRTPAPATPALGGRAPPRVAGGTSGSETTLSPSPSPCTPPARPRGPGDTTVRRNSGGAPARKGPSPAGYGNGRDADCDGGGACGSGSKQQGRRARRNAQRAAMDARGGIASP